MRRSLVTVLAGLVLAAGIVALGRWERGRAGDEANAGIAHVSALVDAPPASARRLYFSAGLTCFLYDRAGRRSSAALCYDGGGRLVEATDGTGAEPRVWSVRDDPALAAVRVEPRVVHDAVDALAVRALVGGFAQHARGAVADCLRLAEATRRRLPNARKVERRAKICRRTVRALRGDLASPSLPASPSLRAGISGTSELAERAGAALERLHRSRDLGAFRAETADLQDRLLAADRELGQARAAVGLAASGPARR